ncbi:MAG: hypothetical protein HRU09_09770 [Oligoflexales bacterium]|nr:hypothetical protein [Oligoflexales bacterium]
MVCRPFTLNEVPGCHCLSLKYSLIASGTYTYGSYWFSLDGESSEFLPPARIDKVMDYYRKFLPLP